MNAKQACLSGNHCTLKLPNLSRIPVIISDHQWRQHKRKSTLSSGWDQAVSFVCRQQSQRSSTEQELQHTNVSWTLETSWVGSGHISPHGQREDLLSSHIHFVQVFLKQTRSALEAAVSNKLKHSPSGLPKAEVELGISVQKTVFHLKKSRCFCCLTSATPCPIIRRDATGLVWNHHEKRGEKKNQLTAARAINLSLQTQCCSHQNQLPGVNSTTKLTDDVMFAHWRCPWAWMTAALCTTPGSGPSGIRCTPSTMLHSARRDNIQRWAGAEHGLCVSVFWPGAILIKHQSYAVLHPPFWGIMWQSKCSSQLTSSLYYLRLWSILVNNPDIQR